MDIPLIVIGAILLFLLLLLLLRVKLYIYFREEVRVYAGMLGIKIRLYPRKKKIKWRNYSPKKAARIAAREEKKRAKEEAKRAARAAKRKEKQESHEREEKTLVESLRLVRRILIIIFKRTRKYLRLHTARLHISVGAGDAAKTAILYGVVCQALSYLLLLLGRVTRLKSTTSEVTVFPDYLSDRCSADIKLVFSMRIIDAMLFGLSTSLAVVRMNFDQNNTSNKKKKAAKQAARTSGTQKGHRHG